MIELVNLRTVVVQYPSFVLMTLIISLERQLLCLVECRVDYELLLNINFMHVHDIVHVVYILLLNPSMSVDTNENGVIIIIVL